MEQLTHILAQLAEKLGTTTEYLWEVLIRQAYVNSMIDIFFIMLTTLLGIGFWRIHKWGCKKSEGKYIENNYGKYEGLIVVPMIIFGILFIVCLCICIGNLKSTLSGFISPEYWALKQVLSIIN